MSYLPRPAGKFARIEKDLFPFDQAHAQAMRICAYLIWQSRGGNRWHSAGKAAGIEKVEFRRRRFTAEDFVAMGKPAEPGDDVQMFQA